VLPQKAGDAEREKLREGGLTKLDPRNEVASEAFAVKGTFHIEGETDGAEWKTEQKTIDNQKGSNYSKNRGATGTAGKVRKAGEARGRAQEGGRKRILEQNEEKTFSPEDVAGTRHPLGCE